MQQYYMPRDCYKQVTIQQDSTFHHWQQLGHSTHATPNNTEKGWRTKRQNKHTKRIPTCHSQENLITIQSCWHIVRETVHTEGKLLCPSACVFNQTHTQQSRKIIMNIFFSEYRNGDSNTQSNKPTVYNWQIKDHSVKFQKSIHSLGHSHHSPTLQYWTNDS